MILKLTRKQVETLKKDAIRNYPEEACAMLFGKTEKGIAEVSWIVIAENILHSKTRFEIDPEIVYEALKEAEERGLDLIGFAHSHTNSSKPSLIDRKFIRLWGDAIWLILSTLNGKMEAFRMVNEKLEKVTLEIT